MSDSMNQIIDVSYVETDVNIENRSTEQLTAEINVRYRQAEALAGMSLQMLADAGTRLIEIKNRIPHGQFEEWCTEHLEFSKSKAEKMMQLADRMADETSLFSKTETFTDIGISRVWALLAAPEEVAAEVVETHNVTDMTVRELKEEIKKLKKEKADAEAARHEAEKTIFPSDEELESAKKDIEDLKKKLVNEEDSNTELKVFLEDANAELEKTKDKLRKAKEKLKAAEAAKDEEIQKRVAEAGAELEEKVRADAKKEAETELKERADAIEALERQVSELEAEKAKLSNTAIMEFKVYADQLQDIYWKLNDMITQEKESDPDMGARMQAALVKIIESWRP